MRTKLSIGMAVALGLGGMVPRSAEARSAIDLLNFDGTNGATPQGPVISYRGKLYGTTLTGGAYNSGALFSIDSRTGASATVYSFTGGQDGANPNGGLTVLGGALYGVTYVGTVFKVDIATGAETTVYTFPSTTNLTGALVYNPSGGSDPYRGDMFGTTLNGGRFGNGSLFRIIPGTGAEQTLRSFKGVPGGGYPALGSLMINSCGEFYGATEPGGGFPGSLFQYDFPTNTLTPLHTFASSGGEGLLALGPLASDAPNCLFLYGATSSGGANGDGTVFSYGNGSRFSVLYSFTGGADGAAPAGSVIYVNGVLYGTTSTGGSGGGGTLFSIDASTGTETTLYSFPGAEGGLNPMSALSYIDGKLIGTTSSGGPSGDGTVFSYRP